MYFYSQFSDSNNDGCFLSDKLRSCTSDEQIMQLFSKIHGPWAFIYWQVNHETRMSKAVNLQFFIVTLIASKTLSFKLCPIGFVIFEQPCQIKIERSLGSNYAKVVPNWNWISMCKVNKYQAWVDQPMIVSQMTRPSTVLFILM